VRFILLTLLILWATGAVYGLTRPLPQDLCLRGKPHPSGEARFLHDLTFSMEGERRTEQQIFDTLLAMIDEADRFILLDMFLFNDLGTANGQRPLAAELTRALLARMRRTPDLLVTIITDPINTGYGSYQEPNLSLLEENGARVITTDLDRLRDSNPLYSGIYRTLLRWWPPSVALRLPNPFHPQGPPFSIKGYLRLLNFKANHRKVMVTDKALLVSSGNVHGPSSLHSNIALLVRGGIIADALAAEQAVASFSEPKAPLPTAGFEQPEASSAATVRLLTERAIKEELLALLNGLRPNDTVWMALFYLADHDILEALEQAAARDVRIRIILDPNKDAFGRKKNGIPNRQSAARLLARTGGRVMIRWYDTRGEQFHPKLFLAETASTAVIIGGSANFTRRNLDGYNLEAALMVEAGQKSEIAAEVRGYFVRIWENRGGLYTLPPDRYLDDSRPARFLAAVQETTGVGTF